MQRVFIGPVGRLPGRVPLCEEPYRHEPKAGCAEHAGCRLAYLADRQPAQCEEQQVEPQARVPDPAVTGAAPAD